MNGELVADDDNGLTEPESAVDDTGGEGDGDLADAVETRVWYDENCDCETGSGGERTAARSTSSSFWTGPGRCPDRWVR